MTTHRTASREEWIAARRDLLAKEKELTRQRDEVSRLRRDLPWVKVDKSYSFEGPGGTKTLAELFDGRSQVIVFHFMFGPEWEEGCRSCSLLADNLDGIKNHLNARDITLVAASRAPLAKLQAFAKRMGWQFPWYSSHGSDFNFDYHVSFQRDPKADGKIYYNYEMRQFPSDEAPGLSAFYKDDSGQVFHTYSTYTRGLDMLMCVYNFLDVAPMGRNEDSLPHPMAWVRHHDRYSS